jgi:monoamine oxidase
MDRHVERSNLEHPDEGPDASELDAITLKEYALKYMGEDAVPLCDVLAQGFLRAEAEEVSALYFVDYVKSGTRLANMISDEKDGGQYPRNRQGNKRH